MTAFTLPCDIGTPLEIIDFKIDLLSSPPEIQAEIINHINRNPTAPSEAFVANYKNGIMVEGEVKIYVCKFKTGRCWLHIFGRINGQEFRTEKEILNNNHIAFNKERILHILQSSRNILKKYYHNSNIESIEHHLVAFIVPA